MRGIALQGDALALAQEMWVRCASVEDIAVACGCSTGAVYNASRRCKFPPRRRITGGGFDLMEDDPTPAAIAAGALRLRIAHMAERRRGA